MYGKATRVRLAKESTWGVRPSSGWFNVAPARAAVSLSGRADTRAGVNAAVAGAVYAVATLEAPATEAALAALAQAALARDADGQIGTYTIHVADAGGAREVRGAAARRFKVRGGIARPAVEFSFEFAGKVSATAGSFAASPGGKHFVFPGAAVTIDSTAVAAKEFSISVNNNVFLGPPDDDNDPSFLTAGRQELTGYLIVADDRRDLVDGDEHSFAVTLPGETGNAHVGAAAVFFTWCREIRTTAAGALQVLYFEGASGGVAAGLSITLG